MAWAVHALTGVLTNVEGLPSGLRCLCNCLNCGGRLEAVNPDRRNPALSPHFRHWELPEDEARCGAVALERAICMAIEHLGEIALPARGAEPQDRGPAAATAVGPAAPFTCEPVVARYQSDMNAVSILLDDGSSFLAGVSAVPPVSQDARPYLQLQTQPEGIGASITQLQQALRQMLEGGRWITPDRALPDGGMPNGLSGPRDAAVRSAPAPTHSSPSEPHVWVWTGSLVSSGRPLERLNSYVALHLKNGQLRIFGKRVDYWAILDEATDPSISSWRVEDAVAAWQDRYDLGRDDKTVLQVLRLGLAVEHIPVSAAVRSGRYPHSR